MSCTKLVLGAVAAVALLAPAAAPAAMLLDFTPLPTSPNVSYSGTAGSKTLTITSPVVNARSIIDIPSVPAPIVDGYETYDDAVLTFTVPFIESGPATSPFPGYVGQSLIGASFSLTFGPYIILEGTFGPSVFFGSGAVGALTAPTVSYTGGLLMTTLIGLGGVPTGDATLNFSQVTPPLGITAGSLNNFVGRIQGQFTTPVVPEPASLGLVGAAAAALMGRRRRA